MGLLYGRAGRLTAENGGFRKLGSDWKDVCFKAERGGGGGGGGPSGTCVADTCGTVTQTSTAGPGTTYQLGLTLASGAKNVYTIYGDLESTMAIPAAYQSDAPFGANIGGVAAGFIAAVPSTAFDSWLTVGKTEGDPAGAISSIGIDWDSWTDSGGLSVDNGAVFWMVPDDGPSGSAVIAQVTVAGDFSATISAQGRSTSGEDWQASGITFSSGGGGGGSAGCGGGPFVTCGATCEGTILMSGDNGADAYVQGEKVSFLIPFLGVLGF